MWKMWDVKTVLPIVLAGVALFFTLRFRSWQAYVYLAQKWYDIQRISMDNPDFLDVSKTSNFPNAFASQSAKDYGSFARICWGFAEDIYYHSNWLNRWLRRGFLKHYLETLREYKKLHFKWYERNERFFGSKGFNDYVRTKL